MSATNTINSFSQEPDCLTYQQASVRLGVSVITLRRWRAEGRFKVQKFSSTLIRIPVSEIERLQKEASGEKQQGVAAAEPVGLSHASVGLDSMAANRLTFAGLAMQALIARGENLTAKNRVVLARMSFQLADEMMKVAWEEVAA